MCDIRFRPNNNIRTEKQRKKNTLDQKEACLTLSAKGRKCLSIAHFDFRLQRSQNNISYKASIITARSSHSSDRFPSLSFDSFLPAFLPASSPSVPFLWIYIHTYNFSGARRTNECVSSLRCSSVLEHRSHVYDAHAAAHGASVLVHRE